MIDFRFHLVSIVSIFLALAVGIVLGAGPLQENLGTRLTDQVQQLRVEKDALRTQLDDANKLVLAQEQYAGLVAPDALRGKLTGKTVAMLVTADSTGKFSQNVQRAVAQAGGRVTSVVTLKDGFFDPTKAPDRATLSARLSPSLGVTSATGSGDDQLGAILAKVLLRPTDGDDPAPVEGAVQALAALKDAGLLDVGQGELRRATFAVVLSGAFVGTSPDVTAQSATGLALVRNLDQAGSGSVVAGGAPSQAVGQTVTTDLVSVVRKDTAVAREASTVDHADSAMGAGVIVLSLVSEKAGVVGHYGTSPDARAVLPSAA